MPIKPPARLFRVDYIDVTRVERLASLEPVVKYLDREVVKVVDRIVYQDDPKLLEQLNKVLKENGELKQALSKKPKEQDNVVERVIENVIEIPKIVRDLKETLLIAALSMSGGFLLCYLIMK